MALQTSGIIYLSQVNPQLGKPDGTPISLGQADVRQLFQVPSGTIYLSQGYGRGLTTGTSDYGTAGNYTFTVPWYNTLYVEVRGAGGGGGASATINKGRGDNGIGGGTSVFYSSSPLVAGGGGGGIGGGQGGGQAGGNGGAYGGSYNSTGGGGAGGAGSPGTYGNGGNGGSGGVSAINFYRGNAGAPEPYTGYTVTVGAKGQNGASNLSGGYDGGVGFVRLSWS